MKFFGIVLTLVISSPSFALLISRPGFHLLRRVNPISPNAGESAGKGPPILSGKGPTEVHDEDDMKGWVLFNGETEVDEDPEELNFDAPGYATREWGELKVLEGNMNGYIWSKGRDGTDMFTVYIDAGSLGGQQPPLMTAKRWITKTLASDPRVEERRQAQKRLEGSSHLTVYIDDSVPEKEHIMVALKRYAADMASEANSKLVQQLLQRYLGLQSAIRRLPTDTQFITIVDQVTNAGSDSQRLPTRPVVLEVGNLLDEMGKPSENEGDDVIIDWKPGTSSVQKKRNLFGNIAKAEADNTQSSEFETYFEAFQAAQANASEIIFPIIKSMTSRSNSSLVWNAAWSIFSDLTATSPIIRGPFSYGMNCIQDIEDNTLNITRMNLSDPNQSLARSIILANNQVLIDLYDEAWANATAALNRTGLLDTMYTLAQYLSPVNDTVLPSGWANLTSPRYDSSYFLLYNTTQPLS